MSGASKACAKWLNRALDYSLSACLIEDVDEGQGIVTLQRHRGIHIFLRCQHPGEPGMELPGSCVNGLELSEERVPGCWTI